MQDPDPIEDLASQGRRDSSGHFTVDLLAARRQLADQGRLEPGLILAKLLQAGVAGAAKDVNFSVRDNRLEARIDFPKVPVNESRVQQYLASAYALARGLEAQELVWLCGQSERNFLGPSEHTGPLQTSGMGRFRLTFPQRSFWQKVSAWFSSVRRPALYLEERACFCAIPIFLDGRRLNRPGRSGAWPGCEVVQLVSRQTPPWQRLSGILPASLAAARVHLEGKTYVGENSFAPAGLRGSSPLKTLLLEGVEGALVEEHSHKQPKGLTLCDFWSGDDSSTFVKQVDWTNPQDYLNFWLAPADPGQTLSCRSWISLSSDTTRTSELWPVRDGLLLTKTSLPQCPTGYRVVMPIEDLHLDVSGLTPIHDEKLVALQARLQEEFIRLRGVWQSLGR